MSLRVLHLGPTPFFSDRGCHIRIRGEIAALQRRGHECWLCTYHHGREVPEVRTERIVSIPGYRKVEAGPSAFKPIADLLLLMRVVGSIWRNRPDVIHAHLHEGALIGWLARWLALRPRTPLLFDMQGSLTGELEHYAHIGVHPPLRPLLRAIEWLVDRLPDAIAASSAQSLDIAREQFGVSPERMTVVGDGVDIGIAAPDEAEWLRERYGVAESATLVVFTGSLLPVKGLELLTAIVVEAARRDTGLFFVLVGYPTEAAAKALQTAGVSANFALAGRVPFDEVARYLGGADIAIEPKPPGSGEASGKLLNYMGAALPVVCFDTPNNREMLGETGCYPSDATAAAFVDALVGLAADRDHARRLGDAGASRVAAHYSWDRSAELLESIYGRIGAGAGATSPGNEE